MSSKSDRLVLAADDLSGAFRTSGMEDLGSGPGSRLEGVRLDVRMTFQINGKSRRLTAPADSFLIDVLRDRLALTGAKFGCGMGECGTCTVLLDGAAVYSCLTLAIEAQSHKITTIEGLARDDGELDPVQRAFADGGGIQCGFCTPGMILTARALLDEQPHPTAEDVRRALSGNLCRCTGYTKIVEAVLAAAEA